MTPSTWPKRSITCWGQRLHGRLSVMLTTNVARSLRARRRDELRRLGQGLLVNVDRGHPARPDGSARDELAAHAAARPGDDDDFACEFHDPTLSRDAFFRRRAI